MRKLVVFNNVTLDGYFAGKNGDISWAKGHMDAELLLADIAGDGE